jgi:P4 family phage/plasmid primase-like protien
MKTDEQRVIAVTVQPVANELSEQNVVNHALIKAAGRFATTPMTGDRVRVVWYDGKRWTDDRIQRLRNLFLPEVMRDIQEMIRGKVASGGYDERETRDAEAFSKSLDDLTRRNRILEGIKLGLPVEVNTFDSASSLIDSPHTYAALWLFNCQNGTVDLLTGELRPHDPADLLTQIAPVEYNPDAVCPTFDAFIERVLPDPAVRAYVQELLGYALNGTMRSAVFPIFYGLGANGKSTLVNTIRTVVGSDYARMLSGHLLESQTGNNRAQPYEKMTFKGRRFMFANETAENMRLDEQRIKELTSDEPISARDLYASFEEFRPTHTVFLQTNHPPRISGTDKGIWRRVREIPFTVEIPEGERDADMSRKLAAEASGILNWLVEGHKRWYDRGERFDTPEAVMLATDEYQHESNPLQMFVEDNFVIAPELRTPSNTIYDRYRVYAEREGLTHRLPKNELVRRLKRQYALHTYRTANERGLEGIGVVGEQPPPRNDGPSDPPPDEPIITNDLTATAAPTQYPEYSERAVDYWGASGDDLYVDLETTGLHPTEDRVRLLTIGLPGLGIRTYDMFNPVEREHGLTVLGNNRQRTLVAHFAQFELAMLEGNFGYVHDGPVFCTNVASQIKHAGERPEPAPRQVIGTIKSGKNKGKPKHGKADSPHSLRSVVYRITGTLLDKSEQRSDWAADELTDEQREYAKLDVEVLPRIVGPLRDAIEGVGTVELDMQNVKIAAHMAVRGVRFDVNAWLALAEPHAAEVARIDGELDALNGEPGNWNSVPQKRALLERETGNTVSSTDHDTVKMLAAYGYKGAQLLAERAEHMKLATTYGEGFLKHVDRGSRIRSTYGVYGAATGRFSSSSPNLQNIPRDPAYRACFKPDEGNVFVIADWSQIEVRYIAAISEDKALQDALASGDVYEATAQKLLNLDSKPTKEQRQLAKAVVLGLQYGLGVVKFRDYAYNTFGVSMSEADARKYRDTFFDAYPRLRQWQRETGDPQELDAYEADGTTNSYTYLGRKRAHIDKYTERINTPIQAAGADALKLALSRLHAHGFDIALHVHDEVVLQSPPELAEHVKRELTDIMETAALEAIEPELRVPVPVEVAIGDSWADKA